MSAFDQIRAQSTAAVHSAIGRDKVATLTPAEQQRLALAIDVTIERTATALKHIVEAST